MGNQDNPEIDKIISEMRIIIERIKKNENKINKSIKYRIQGIYYDFNVSQVPDKELLSEFYYTVGFGYQLLSGKENKIKALEFLQQAEDIIDKNNFDRLYEVYNEMGIAYYMIENYDLAYLFYKKAYELGIDYRIDVNKISASLVNLSTLNTLKGEYELAITQLKKSLEIFEYDSVNRYEVEAQSFFGVVYHDLAVNYVKLFEYESSLEYYKLGIKYIKNFDSFRSKLVKRIQFIMKDTDDKVQMESLKKLIIKIKHLS